MQETHRREAADLNLREAFTDELALEANARDAEDTALGAQLKELRVMLSQELETLGKACTEELAGEATTREAEDTALRVKREELQASIADFATRPWCEQDFSAIWEKLSENMNEAINRTLSPGSPGVENLRAPRSPGAGR